MNAFLTLSLISCLIIGIRYRIRSNEWLALVVSFVCAFALLGCGKKGDSSATTNPLLGVWYEAGSTSVGLNIQGGTIIETTLVSGCSLKIAHTYTSTGSTLVTSATGIDSSSDDCETQCAAAFSKTCANSISDASQLGASGTFTYVVSGSNMTLSSSGSIYYER